MGGFSTILQNAILYVAGSEGLEKFRKAGHEEEAKRMASSDGSLDLQMLMNALLDVFPEEQASAIADDVLARYVGMPPEGSKREYIENGGAQEDPGDASYADSLAKYLETEASDVRGLINEARRIRIAMGKASQAALQAATPEPIVHVTHVPSTPEPRVEGLNEITLDDEVKRFVDARRAPTSVDIMDFIRYLKDKGYSFQENVVLEKVYAGIEELKSRERAELRADIQAFLKGVPWPSEGEVSAYIERKKSEGVLCESAEIKRMILVEMIQKY
ncbi:hypothetical protein [Methanocella conradii]|uniref:hypothetical protein n=1 Tax=Methanocella conradii TaxID=1175444 RepID=UPI00157E0E69|nr:hypothetical protein [Methanocella conradii]